MRLKIKEVDFTNQNNWIFKLGDSFNEYYIFEDEVYNSLGISSPINKSHLDSLDVGYSVLCDVDEIRGLKLVVRIK